MDRVRTLPLGNSKGLGLFKRRTFNSAVVVNAVVAEERFEPQGAWVYSEIEDWNFEKFDTIHQAIRHAISLGKNAVVICRGKEIKFNLIDNDRAYFKDFDNKLKLVEL
jgi:hypothetical protein